MSRNVTLALVLSIAAALALRLAYAWHGNLAYDEYQHMHAAYLVAQGQTPFVDFFEHHTPLLYYVAAALVPMRSPSFDTMIHARYLSLAFHVLTIGLAALWVRSIAGRVEALVVAALLAGNFCLFIWGTRTYVDTYAAPFLVLSAWMLTPRGRQPSRYAVAGASLTLAVLFTQKAALAGPAVAVVLLARLPDVFRERSQRRAWAVDLAALLGGVLIPLLLLPALLGRAGVVGLVRDAIVLNLHWKARHFPTRELAILFASDGFIYAVALAGLAARLWQMLQRRLRLEEQDVACIFLAALAVGVGLLPVVFEEYFILLLPFATIVAGLTLVRWWRSYFQGGAGRRSSSTLRRGAIVCLFVLAAATDLIALRVATSTPLSWPALVAILCLWLVLGGALYAMPRSDAAAALALALVLVLPIVEQIDWIPRHRNDDDRARVEYVMAHTRPTDPVFDGRSGYGVFRPHAYRYWFLHDEMQLMLSEQQKSTDIIRALEQQRVRIALADDFVALLPVAVRDYIATHYVDTPFPDIKQRAEGGRG